MGCTGCGRANRPDARFCSGCGASLALHCPSCGAAAAPAARFCDACGASLAAAAADDRGARKVVTILFADLIGSTALQERLDPESVSRVMEDYHRAVRAPVEARNGSVVQLLGDGVMCAFGIPMAGEDDALRAVQAGVAVQQAFREFLARHPGLAGRIGLRVALNTGEVVVSDDYAAGIGDPLNVAARLQQEAKDGDVLIGGETQRLVADRVTLEPLGVFALKGRAEPVAAYRVASLEQPARAAASFVGREAELRRLRAVFDAAAAERRARLAVVLGSPGLGKSRLLSELTRGLAGRASVLVAQCPAAGGATFAPLAEALRAALEAAELPDEAERARVSAGIAAILAGRPAPPEESFFVVRRLLSALAAARPVVLAIDDLHWAEPLLLDLVEHLVQWGAGVPLLVVAAARPELRDARSSLAAAGGLVADVLTLGGLDAASATRLAASVVGAEALPAGVAGRVLATSEGNPLFLGELVRMLVNDGVLRREGDSWVAATGLAELEMPPTIQALLAARIERLRPEERLVLERAAVIGRRFSRAAVAHLLPREAHADLDARLEALRRSELTEPDPDGGWFLGEPALRFHHVLIRDAAYRRTLRSTRADLHVRFADWLAGQAGADAAAHDETIGWHLEQAFAHRREIGPLDAGARALGERAARHLADAGRRALARDDVSPAATLLGRALDCLDPDDPSRAELVLDRCESLLAAGQVAPAAGALAELARFAAGSDRLRAWHACFAGQLAVLADPQALRASSDAVAAAAEMLARADDAAGEAKAHSVHALVLAQLGKIGACEAALDRALAAARGAGDRRRANAVLAGAPLAALWGPSPVTRASGRCLDVVRVLRITQGAPAVEAVALRCQAVLETLRGRSDAARRMIASSRRMLEELGITQRLLEADVFAGLIALLEGDGEAAERSLRPAYAGLRAQGLGIDAAQAGALLGRALLAQGRVAEAEALSHESEALAGDSFKAAIAWRCVRAEALAARGEPEAAIGVARGAVEIAAATDDLLDHADARRALAVALSAAGRHAEAGAEMALAVELWEQKGATLLAERARAGSRSETPRGQPDGARAAERGVRRRVRENAATRCIARFRTAAHARDMDTIVALCEDLQHLIHHPTGALIDHEAGLRRWRLLLRSEGLELATEILATLGESLALGRDATSFTRLDQDDLSFGASSSRYLNLFEVNEAGRAYRIEVFGEDRLGEAVARLYARHAELLPDGPERDRAAGVARSLAALLTASFTADTVAAIVAGEVEYLDRRRFGFPPVIGTQAVERWLRSLADTASEVVFRCDDVLAAEPGALLARWTNLGREHAGGGAFERHFFSINAFDGEGRLLRWEHFDPEDEADALARFDEIATQTPEPARRRVAPNAATAHAARIARAVVARDLAAVQDSLTEDARVIHHPTGLAMDRRGTADGWRSFFDDRAGAFRLEPVASLGDALALFQETWSGSASGEGALELGAFETGLWTVLRVKEALRADHIENFSPDRLDAALARLYELWSEGLPHGAERASAEAAARSLRRAARGERCEDVLALSPDLLLARWVSAEAGRTELRLARLAPEGGVERFAPDQEREALMRFAALDAEARGPFASPATAVGERLARCWAERDWDGVMDRFAAGFELDDRRALMGLRVSGREFVANQRLLFGLQASRFESRVIATRGERSVLRWTRFWGEDEAGGRIEVPVLSVTEVDGTERYVWQGLYDPDALDAAYAALDARFAAGEASAHAGVGARLEALRRAFAEGDRDALARILPPGAELTCPDAPDPRATLWLDHVRISAASFLAAFAWRSGPADGADGAALLLVGAHRDGALLGVERFGPERAAAAVARYRALAAGHATSEARLPNAATRSMDRLARAWGARDWDGVAAEFAPDFRQSDRRRLVRLELDRDDALRSLRSVYRAEEGRLTTGKGGSHAVLATRGERLVLASTGFAIQHRDVGPSEISSLTIIEVDESGRRTALAIFDEGASDAAWAELDARFATGEAAAHPHVARAMQAFVGAFARRDWNALGAVFAEDVVVHDRRRLGWEPLCGRAAYLDSLRSLVELAPDARLRLEHVRISARALLWVAAWTGTREGGPFEAPWVIVSEHDAEGRVRRFDQLDLDSLDAALARFEALRPAPPLVAPNAALRAAERTATFLRAGDWQGLQASLAPDFSFDDRRRLALVSGGGELYVENLRVVHAYPGLVTRREILATAGDRVSLSHLCYEGGAEGGTFRGEFLLLLHVAPDGRVRAAVHFDVDDRAAAFAEAQARFAAGEAGGAPGQAAISALGAAFTRHDWATLRACFTDAAETEDHRRLGLGRFPVDGWIESLRAFAGLAPDVSLEPLRILAWSERGRVSVLRVRGTREGGPFENVFVGLAILRGDRIQRYEFFDVADAERALARFAERSPR